MSLRPGDDPRIKERVAIAQLLKAGERYPYKGKKAALKGKLVRVIGFRPDGGLHVQFEFPCSPHSVVPISAGR
jgi:hypothetical protein